jgi:hypothetical protein
LSPGLAAPVELELAKAVEQPSGGAPRPGCPVKLVLFFSSQGPPRLSLLSYSMPL